MTGKTTVVTPQRYEQGLSYAEFLAQAKVNVDQFDSFYASAPVSAEDAAFFKQQVADGKAAKMLVIGEDWCPDVYRGMPLAVRIAEAGGMEVRIFPRDKNLDVMNEFLNKGEFMSIPVVVFYTKDMKYVAHWIERSAAANEDRAKIAAEVKAAMPGATEQDERAEVRKRSAERYPAWQQASVREIRELLARSG